MPNHVRVTGIIRLTALFLNGDGAILRLSRVDRPGINDIAAPVKGAFHLHGILSLWERFALAVRQIPDEGMMAVLERRTADRVQRVIRHRTRVCRRDPVGQRVPDSLAGLR